MPLGDDRSPSNFAVGVLKLLRNGTSSFSDDFNLSLNCATEQEVFGIVFQRFLSDEANNSLRGCEHIQHVS